VAQINNGAALTKTTSGALILTGSNAYTGLTTVSQGTLQVQSPTGLGSAAAGTSVTSGATLEIDNVAISNGEQITLNGTGISAAGALTATGTAAANGSVVLAANSSVGITASGDQLTLSGQITGTGFGLTKVGVGTLVLANTGTANSYSGTTVVSAGTLKFGASNQIPSGAGNGNVTVNGTLDLSGFSNTINGLTGNGVVDNTAAAGISTLTVGANAQTSSFAGLIQNSGASAVTSLTKTGTGTFTLTNTNTYSGATTVIGGGTLRNGINNALPTGTALTLGESSTNTNGTYDLAGFSQTVSTLAAAGSGSTHMVTNSATATTSTLSVSGSSTFSGTIQDGAGVMALSKTVSGTLTMTGSNTYTGPTNVTGGTLEISGSINGSTSIGINGAELLLSGSGNMIKDTASVGLTNGTLAFNPASYGISETVGALSLSGASAIDFGSSTTTSSQAGNTFTFASGATLNAGATLSIYNWSGSPYILGQSDTGTASTTPDTQDRLLFAGSGSGLNATQLGQISFYSGGAGSTLLGTGGEISFNGGYEIVPVPEPSSTALLGGASLLALAGFRQRRKAGKKNS
jgi:autotransporter-associated beta strand protein